MEEEVVGVRERVRSALAMHAVELADEDISSKQSRAESKWQLLQGTCLRSLTRTSKSGGLAPLQIHITWQGLLHVTSM